MGFVFAVPLFTQVPILFRNPLLKCFQWSICNICKGAGGVGNQKTSRDHPNYNITKIGQNRENCPGDFRRLAVTQTPVKDHHLMMVRKKSQGKLIIIIIQFTALLRSARILRRVLETFAITQTPARNHQPTLV